MKEINKGIKKLIKLMKDNPDLEVVVGCDAIDVEIETDYLEMQIISCYLDNRAIYFGIIFYDKNELIDEIMDIEEVSEESAIEKANNLMKTIIVIQAKRSPV